MPRKPLTNTFGFASLCFVCDPDNASGLGLRFFLDDEKMRIVGEYTPQPGHSGAPNYTHGGASMAVLDDAMAWAIIALNERFGITRKAEVDFVRPVMISATHPIEAWVESFEERALVARAELRNPEGKLCVAAKGTYIVMTMEEATNAIGAGAAAAPAYTEPTQ